MHFTYQGFTHAGNIRSFNFEGIDEGNVHTPFLIQVNLLLLARTKVAMQDAPGFCLHLLTTACASTPADLEKFQHYEVLEEDLLPLVMDRERRATLKALKVPQRRFGRKPPQSSQFRPSARPEA
ncbi:MAG TPA: hypothetical protein VH325_16415 [Bryobacteraceae bacterium]|jgi:hypothetical protein|nr:hypothetical protein [Bryobacteraceae bacterium]